MMCGSAYTRVDWAIDALVMVAKTLPSVRLGSKGTLISGAPKEQSGERWGHKINTTDNIAPG